LGIIFFGHGAQKMLGWYGGPGLASSMRSFTEHLHLPSALAFLVIVGTPVQAIRWEVPNPFASNADCPKAGVLQWVTCPFHRLFVWFPARAVRNRDMSDKMIQGERSPHPDYQTNASTIASRWYSIPVPCWLPNQSKRAETEVKQLQWHPHRERDD